MGKEERMKEREEQAKQAPRIVSQLTFNVIENNDVIVSGPIKNKEKVAQILSSGLLSLFTYYAAQGQDAARIVAPDPKMIASLMNGKGN